jgi:mono/diheme cytochrome c family protein
MKNPFPWGDKAAVAMGELLYEKACIRCHWPTREKPYSFSFMSAAWSQSVQEHPDFYFWTISEGRVGPGGGGMPPHKDYLPAKQRWEVLNYLWSMGEEFKKNAIG